MSVKISDELHELFIAARDISLAKSKFAISPTCFLLAVFENSAIITQLNAEKADAASIVALQQLIADEPSYEPTIDKVPLYKSLEKAVFHAIYFQQKLKDKSVGTVHVLLSLLSYDNILTPLLQNYGMTYENIAALTTKKKMLLSAKKSPEEVLETSKKTWWKVWQ